MRSNSASITSLRPEAPSSSTRRMLCRKIRPLRSRPIAARLRSNSKAELGRERKPPARVHVAQRLLPRGEYERSAARQRRFSMLNPGGGTRGLQLRQNLIVFTQNTPGYFPNNRTRIRPAGRAFESNGDSLLNFVSTIRNARATPCFASSCSPWNEPRGVDRVWHTTDSVFVSRPGSWTCENFESYEGWANL